MRTPLALLAFAAALFWAGPALAQPGAERCVFEQSVTRPQSVIAACTEMINAGLRSAAQLARAYSSRCAAYNVIGANLEGLADCSTAILLDPSLAEAYRRRCISHTHLRRYELAIADATHAIELDPTDYKALNNRGIVYGARGQYDRAIQDYDRAIKLKPDFTQAANNRRIATRNKRRYDGPMRADLGWRAFEFPAHANEGVFGIDVSHHNEDGRWPIAWHELISQGVSFVYAKATQGRRFYDDRFERTWTEVAKLQEEGQEIYRGAYHFLASNVDPAEQAENFLSAIGTLGPKDLPPCVDIEWHMASADDDSVDLWNSFSEAEIVEKLSKFIAIVEAATGRKPLIYTARSWWRKNIPTSRRFEDYPIWIADYAPHLFDPDTPVESLEPRVMHGHQWAIWQFTDTGRARFGALPGMVDVSIFKGTMSDFKLAFGIKTPPALPAPPPHAAAPQR